MRMLKVTLPVRLASFALLLLAAMPFQCKEEEQIYFEEETIVQNAGLGQIEAYDALEVAYFIEVQFLVNPGATSLTDIYSCSTYVNDAATKTITMNFPATPCSAGLVAYPYSRIRSGKMIVQYETEIGDTLSNRSISFEDYYVNGKKLEGIVTLSNIIRNTSNNHLYALVTLDGFKVSFNSGSSVTFYGKQTRAWTSGEADLFPINNTYTVSTLSDSLNIAGPGSRTFKSVISSPLKLNFSCAFPGNLSASSGIIKVSEISGIGDSAGSVNFGTGTCDKAVTVTTSRRNYATSVN